MQTLSPEEAKARHLRMIKELEEQVAERAAIRDKKLAAFLEKNKKDKDK